MADSDDLDLDGGDVSDSDGAQKKRGGGLGTLIFIVTVSVITYNIMNRGGKSQTVLADPSSPYVGKRPEYAMYTLLGSITTRTKDYPTSSSVTVEMIIGYDMDDPAAASELTGRQYELRDFVRRYFTGKYAAELAPEREEELKKDIREQLNTRFLDTARARIILFNRLDIMDMY